MMVVCRSESLHSTRTLSTHAAGQQSSVLRCQIQSNMPALKSPEARHDLLSTALDFPIEIFQLV